MPRALARRRVVVALAIAFVLIERQAVADNPPNIVLILADDLRFDALGYAGNKLIRTPNIDRLAARGTVFTNSFCTETTDKTGLWIFLSVKSVVGTLVLSPS